MNNKLVIVVILPLICFFYFSEIIINHNNSYAISEHSINNDLNKTNDNVFDQNQDDEIIMESDITTKIYRSTDPSINLIDGKTDFDSSIQENILSKDDLLQGKSKLNLNKNKIIKINLSFEKNNNFIKPILFVILLCILLYVIFFILKKKKV